MKSVLLIIDGLADRPQPALDGRTPLECAVTPTLDDLTAGGRIGRITPTPGRPGAALSTLLAVLGAEGFSEPMEARSSRWAPVPDDKTARPLNNMAAARFAHGWFAALARGLVSGSDRRLAAMLSLMTEDNGVVADQWLDDLKPEEVKLILTHVLRPLEDWKGWELSTNAAGDVIAVAPPGIEPPAPLPPAPRAMGGRTWRDLLPRAHVVARMVTAAHARLAGSTVSAVRVDLGQNPVSLAWLWGMGALSKGVPPAEIRTGGVNQTKGPIRLTLCTASDVAAGAAHWLGHGVVRAGMHEPAVLGEPEPVAGLGAFGSGGSSRRAAARRSSETTAAVEAAHAAAFKALAERTLAHLADGEVVVVHTGVVDAASARRRPEAKRRLVELMDEHLLAPLVAGLGTLPKTGRSGGYRIGVMAGSLNDSSTGRHGEGPLPFCVSGSDIPVQSMNTLTEANADRAGIAVADAAGFVPWLMHGL